MSFTDTYISDLVDKYKKFDDSFNAFTNFSKKFEKLFNAYVYNDVRKNGDETFKVELLNILNSAFRNMDVNNEPEESQLAHYSIYKSYWNFEQNEFKNNFFNTKLKFYIISTLLSIYEFEQLIRSSESEKVKILILTTQSPSELSPSNGQADNKLLEDYTKGLDQITNHNENGESNFEISRFFLVNNNNNKNEKLNKLLMSVNDITHQYCEVTSNIGKCKECDSKKLCSKSRAKFMDKNKSTTNYFFKISNIPTGEFFTELIVFGIKNKNGEVSWKRAFVSDLNRLTSSLSIQILNNEKSINSTETKFIGYQEKVKIGQIIKDYINRENGDTLNKIWENFNATLFTELT